MGYKYQVALSFATEEQELVDTVYHYLKASGINVFFAPSAEAQVELSGKNQREVFFDIFGRQSEYVALFVSENYIRREVPIEEAKIAIATHDWDGKVIPIYLDKTSLPETLINHKRENYYSSNNPAEIAVHIVRKIELNIKSAAEKEDISSNELGGFRINNNQAHKQIVINKNEGSITF